MLYLFLDESGDHNLQDIGSEYPIFVLAGCVIEKQYYETTVKPELVKLKLDIFGNNDVILHTADITRNRNGFQCLKDADFRQHFYARLNRLLSELDFTVLACAIHKRKHLLRYGLAARNPYMLSLDCLLERFVYMLRERSEEGVIMSESRGGHLDGELRLVWRALQMDGTRYLRGHNIRRHVTSLTLCDKKDDVAGIQLADLCATPIGRHFIGKHDKQDWEIIQRKLRSRNGNWRGYGLVELPK